jgi:hypothetical protein
MDDMDDEREDEFMDSMPEPTQSHAQLLELRKRFVTYLARLDEQIRRAAVKEERDRVTTDTDRIEIDWLEKHVAQVEEPLPDTAYPRENTWTPRDVNADSSASSSKNYLGITKAPAASCSNPIGTNQSSRTK